VSDGSALVPVFFYLLCFALACRVPPNVEFYVDDIEEQWNFHSPFDFVYFRMMTGSIKDWPKALRQAYE